MKVNYASIFPTEFNVSDEIFGKHIPVEVINDASVKFNELVKKENEEKALAGAEGEVN